MLEVFWCVAYSLFLSASIAPAHEKEFRLKGGGAKKRDERPDGIGIVFPEYPPHWIDRFRHTMVPVSFCIEIGRRNGAIRAQEAGSVELFRFRWSRVDGFGTMASVGEPRGS